MTSRQRPTQLALIPTVVPDVRQAEPHREEPLRRAPTRAAEVRLARPPDERDRKSTRLNSSHGYISYAVFCLKKKNKDNQRIDRDINTLLHSLTTPFSVRLKL